MTQLLKNLIPKHWRPYNYLTRLTRQQSECIVIGGPFQSMRYIDESVCSTYIPKLLGIYEKELYAVIEEACRLGFSRIVDVGAAEGYYAVGMALRNPQTQIIAFEMDPRGQAALKRLALLNRVGDRITIHGKCAPLELQKLLAESEKKTLIICDVEGFEETLLDPASVPSLRNSWILVELHDFLKPGIKEILVSRLAETHSIQELLQEARSASEFPFRTVTTALLPQRYLSRAVSERRDTIQSWLWMQPRVASRT